MPLDTLRCSGLPESFECAGAAHVSDLVIESSGEASTLGSAGHEAMRPVVEAGATNPTDADVPAIAARFGVDEKELARLVWAGIDMWKSLEPSFRGALTEVPVVGRFPGFTLTGHADLLVVDGRIAQGLDWKSGRVDRDFSEQMRGYCACVLAENPDVDEVVWVVAWLREREIERYAMKRSELPAWVERVRQEIIGWDGRTFRPGRHCGYCRRSHDCRALVATAKRDIAILGEPSLAEQISVNLVDVPPQQIVALYRKAKLVEGLARSFTEAVRTHLATAKELDSGDGKALVLGEEERREVDALKAWPSLEKRLTPEELATCIDVRISKVEEVVAKKAGKGKGAGAKRDLAAELDAAEAVKITTHKKIKEVRK